MDSLTETPHNKNIRELLQTVTIDEKCFSRCLAIYNQLPTDNTVSTYLVNSLTIVVFSLGVLLSKESNVTKYKVPEILANSDDLKLNDTLRFLFAIGYLYNDQVEQVFAPLFYQDNNQWQVVKNEFIEKVMQHTLPIILKYDHYDNILPRIAKGLELTPSPNVIAFNTIVSATLSKLPIKNITDYNYLETIDKRLNKFYSWGNKFNLTYYDELTRNKTVYFEYTLQSLDNATVCFHSYHYYLQTYNQTPTDDEVREIADAIKSNTKMESFSPGYHAIPFTPTQLKMLLLAISDKVKLKSINVSDIELGDEGFTHLIEWILEKQPQISEFSACKVGITGVGCKNFAERLANYERQHPKRLQFSQVTLEENIIGDDAMLELLSHMPFASKLMSLNLKMCQLSDAAADKLTAVFLLREVESCNYLYLDQNHFTNVAAKYICKLVMNVQVQQLTLRQNHFTDEALKSFLAAKEYGHIKDISLLCGNEFSAQGFADISKLNQHHFKTLSHTNTPLTKDHLIFLQQTFADTKKSDFNGHEIYLDNCQLENCGSELGSLCHIFATKTRTHRIHISNNPRFAPTSLAAFIKIFGANSNISTLNLINCGITDDSFLQLLNYLPNLSQLKRLDISKNHLTKKSVTALLTRLQEGCYPTLKFINVANNCIIDKALLSKLKKTLISRGMNKQELEDLTDQNQPPIPKSSPQTYFSGYQANACHQVTAKATVRSTSNKDKPDPNGSIEMKPLLFNKYY